MWRHNDTQSQWELGYEDLPGDRWVVISVFTDEFIANAYLTLAGLEVLKRRYGSLPPPLASRLREEQAIVPVNPAAQAWYHDVDRWKYMRVGDAPLLEVMDSAVKTIPQLVKQECFRRGYPPPPPLDPDKLPSAPPDPFSLWPSTATACWRS